MAESAASVTTNTGTTSTTAVLVVLALLLCLPAAMCELVKCTKPELSPCYCGKTTYDRQELYAVNCTATALSMQKSLDVLMNLPDETEVRYGLMFADEA